MQFAGRYGKVAEYPDPNRENMTNGAAIVENNRSVAAQCYKPMGGRRKGAVGNGRYGKSRLKLDRQQPVLVAGTSWRPSRWKE